jgi:hypothetical protein
MYQEVVQVKPWATLRHADDYGMVDYGMLLGDVYLGLLLTRLRVKVEDADLFMCANTPPGAATSGKK